MKGKFENYQDKFDRQPSKKNVKYVDIYSSESKKIKKGSRIPVLKILSFIFFLFLGVIGSAMIYAYNTLHSYNYQEIETTPEETIDEEAYVGDLCNDKMILNILLIGSDSMSVGDQGRSDSLMLVSLDIRNKKIKVTSLMRDLWVDIPKYGKDRINAAYAYGRAKLTIETIQKNFGVLIDRYICVDFEGFAKIIDSLGGIDMELTSAECQYINKYSGDPHTLKGSGIKHLTGLQALNHARNRNSKGSDYDRTMRQRDVIRAMIEGLKKSNVAKITEIVSNIGPMTTTNFKPSEIARLAKNSMTYVNYPMHEFRLPTNDNVRDEVHNQKMVLAIIDMAKAKKDLKKFIYEDAAEDEEKATTSANKSVTQNYSTGKKSTQTTENSKNSQTAKTSPAGKKTTGTSSSKYTSAEKKSSATIKKSTETKPEINNKTAKSGTQQSTPSSKKTNANVKNKRA